MVKANNHNNPQAAEFTDYTVASSKHGQVEVALMRINYKHDREMIELRRMNRLDNRFWDTRQKPHPVKVRAGFPKKREPDPERIRNKGVPHSKFLKQFKIIERLVGTGFGDFVWVAKVYVLHATRGWKLYA